MSDSTRRNFLIASGAGAAAVGVAAAMPGVAAAAPVPAAPLSTPKNAQPLVAHIGDPSTGTMSLFSGEHEVLVHDPELVARLTRAAVAGSQQREA
ncbi:MAG: twin-arginine translocation signal domain-containing protein [Jatrophihabitans sp.]